MDSPLLQYAVTEANGVLVKAANATMQGIESIGRGQGLEASQNATGMFQSGDMVWGNYIQMLGSVFLLLAVLFLAVYLLKRYGPRAGLRVFHRGDLKMESQLPLGPKKSVVVVRFLNKRLVVGVTDSQINLLTTVEVDQDAESKGFSQALTKAQKDDAVD